MIERTFAALVRSFKQKILFSPSFRKGRPGPPKA